MSRFAERFRAGEPLLATFFRTPSHSLAEVLSRAPVDAVCVDAEHSALDRAQIDPLLLAFRASGMPAVVRVPDHAPNSILSALDMGAGGVMVPHLITGEDAHAVVDAATYRTAGTPDGARGYAGATRAAGYGARAMRDAIAAGADRLVIGQVEEREALEHVDGIVAVDGLDCVFIGRSDLTISFGHTDTSAPEVMEAVELVARKASEAGRVVGTFTANLDEIPALRALGISFFLLGSEADLMLRGARDFAAEVRGRF